MKTMEVWKPIEGYEGYYEVSNYGKVRSLDRTILKKNGHKQIRKGVILKPSMSRTGTKTYSYYLHVNLSKNDICETLRVHKLVADAFIKNKPKKCKYEVMHLDNDGTNNHIGNLRYGSHSCNVAFRFDNGTSIRGVRNPHSKLTEKEVLRIRKMYSKGIRQVDLVKKFNITKSAIHRIVSNKNWAWL